LWVVAIRWRFVCLLLSGLYVGSIIALAARALKSGSVCAQPGEVAIVLGTPQRNASSLLTILCSAWHWESRRSRWIAPRNGLARSSVLCYGRGHVLDRGFDIIDSLPGSGLRSSIQRGDLYRRARRIGINRGARYAGENFQIS